MITIKKVKKVVTEKEYIFDVATGEMRETGLMVEKTITDPEFPFPANAIRIKSDNTEFYTVYEQGDVIP
mgnify:CR=1 FL=1